MRHESYVTFLSWIPSEAATGAARVAFGTGPARYDNPPPGEPGDFDGLRRRTGSVPRTFCGPGSRWLTPDSAAAGKMSNDCSGWPGARRLQP